MVLSVVLMVVVVPMVVFGGGSGPGDVVGGVGVRVTVVDGARGVGVGGRG